MIDLSNLKAPGWSRVVAELNTTAPDDRTFLERLLAILTQVSTARQGVLYLGDRGEGDQIEPRPTMVWPPPAAHAAETAAAPQSNGDVSTEIESLAESKKAARASLESGQARAFGLDKETQYYDAQPGQGYIIAVPVAPGLTAGAAPAGAVITLLIEPRGREAVRSTLAMAEVLAGYAHGHAVRQALKRTQQASFALDLAARLIASINTAPNFKGAAMQLCNDLAKQFSVDRVALGWAKTRDGDEIRAQAISDTEHFDRRMVMVQKLEAAMNECLDQEQPVLFPPPPAEGPRGDVLLAQAITHAHRELASGDAKLKICSLPLRIDEDVVGVVTIETAGEGAVELATIELIQSALDLIAPVLRIRRSDDRIVALRTWDSVIRAGAWAVGPKHTVWKLVGIAVLALMSFVTFYTTTYRVGAEAVLEPVQRRIVSAPQDGVIARLGTNADGEELEAGMLVQAGDLLVQLDSKEWELSALDSRQKIAQAELQAAAARAEGDRGKVEQAEAQRRRAEAELRMYEHRIERSRIVAPISGTIIGGRLKDRVGGAVKLGDGLLEIAPLDVMIVVARVDERDIALVTEAFENDRGRGRLATKSYPAHPFDLEVERIVPLSEPKDGKNAFEVRARVVDPAPWMRPGMEGLAKFDTQDRSLLWIGTRRIIDTIRLWLW